MADFCPTFWMIIPLSWRTGAGLDMAFPCPPAPGQPGLSPYPEGSYRVATAFRQALGTEGCSGDPG